MPPHTPAVAGPLPVCASRDTDAFLKRKRGVTLENALLRFLFYCFFPTPQDAIWDATSYVAGGVGRAAPQTKAPTSKHLCANFPNIPRCFSMFFAPFLCPKGHRLGLNALRLRGGMGAAQAPISEPHPLQTREAFMPARASFGMQHPMLPGAWGEQSHKPKPPHPKTSAPTSQTFHAVFQCFLHLFYARKGIVWD